MGSGNGVIPWGLADLDRMIGTGYPGRLVTIGARPSNGKSTFLLNWLNAIYANIYTHPHRVLCFWTEHTTDIAYLTWACLRFGLPLDPVIKGEWDDLPEGSEEAVAVELRQLRYEERIVFAPTERPSIVDVRRFVDDLAPDIVIFDYLQRIKPLSGQSKFEALADAAITFRELSISAPLLAVIGSQLKRRGDGVFDKYRPPYMEDFKGAGEIEETANIALGLFRPLKRMTAKDEKAVKTGELDLEQWKIPHCMAIKVLKHHYWPDAADRLVRVRCEDGQVRDWETDQVTVLPPPDAGDAWEPEDDGRQDDLPF